MAIITQIYKSGALTDASNYRPISILPVISNILEKVIANQLIIYLKNNQFYHSKQFGFHKKCSAETALCHFVERIKCPRDNRNVVGAVFLDLKKAFDTVNHGILFSKLRHQFHFSVLAVTWLSTYVEY